MTYKVAKAPSKPDIKNQIKMITGFCSFFGRELIGVVGCVKIPIRPTSPAQTLEFTVNDEYPELMTRFVTSVFAIVLEAVVIRDVGVENNRCLCDRNRELPCSNPRKSPVMIPYYT